MSLSSRFFPRSSLRLGRNGALSSQLPRSYFPPASSFHTCSTQLASSSAESANSSPSREPREAWNSVLPNPERRGPEQLRQDYWIETLQYHSFTVKLRSNEFSNYINRLHLRDACRCPKCVDPSTKQKNFRHIDLNIKTQIKNISNEDGKLVVKWNEDPDQPDAEHVSHFTKEEIKDLLPRASRSKQIIGTQIKWNQRIFQNNQPWISFEDYVKRGAEYWLWMRDLQRYGLAFIKGAPETNEAVADMANNLGPIRNTFYGQTWDVRNSPDAKNVAYTNKDLGFHMDLLYMNEPPGYQLLHCLKNSVAGGESIFTDGFMAAQVLSKNNPDAFSILSEFPVRFGYDNAGEYYEHTRPTIELYKPNTLSETTKARPHVKHLNYSPPFQLPFMRSDDLNWLSKFKQFFKAYKEFTQVLERPTNVFKLKMNPGDCVVFENRRVLHGRGGFDHDESGEGARWLRGAYVDSDAVESKFRTLRSRDRDGWDSKLLVKFGDAKENEGIQN